MRVSHMFRPFSLLLIAAITLAPFASAQEVATEEVLHRGDNVEHINTTQHADIMGVPTDDNHKWFITVITARGCLPCQKLESAFVNDPHLRSLVNVSDHKKSWAHYNVYLHDDASQKFRWEKIKLASYPTILVQPPINKSFGNPSTVVFQASGFDGDGKKLAAKIVATIRAYVDTRRGFQNVGVDPPWTPAPKVEPAVNPSPAPSPFVDIPVIPPVEVPKPDAPKPDAPSDNGPCTEAIVITDADNGLADENSENVRNVIEALRTQRGRNLKVRLMDWRDAKDRYPVQRDDVPVILVTKDGQIEDKISGRLLPFLGPQNPPPVEPKAVTLADVPWSAIITLLTTGFSIPAAAALGLWGFKFFRSRRQAAGKPVLLSDAALEQVLALLPVAQQWIEERFKKPPPDTTTR